MSSEIDSTELHSLFAEWTNHTITPQQHQRLQAMLLQTPQARQEWFLYCDVETGLRDWAVTETERRANALPSGSLLNSNA